MLIVFFVLSTFFTSFAVPGTFRVCLCACSSPSAGLQRRCSLLSVAGPYLAKYLTGHWCRLLVPASASSSSAVHRLCHQGAMSLQSGCGCHWLQSIWRTCCGSLRPGTRQTNQSSSSGIFLTLEKQTIKDNLNCEAQTGTNVWLLTHRNNGLFYFLPFTPLVMAPWS